MTKQHCELSIIIPIFNEAKNIEQTLRSIKKYVRVPHEVITVYDFDTDTTLPLLHKLKKRYKQLRILKNTVATGPSGALRAGFRNAKAPRILVTMADLSDDLYQIPNLIQLVPKKADIACPSRYCKGGRQELQPSLKVWSPRTAGFLLHFLTAIPTVDPTNSFKMYSAKVIKSLNLRSRVSFSVTLEIMAKAHVLGFRITEIPTVWHDRQHGKTNFQLLPSLISYTPWFFLSLLRNRLFALPQSLMRKVVNVI